MKIYDLKFNSTAVTPVITTEFKVKLLNDCLNLIDSVFDVYNKGMKGSGKDSDEASVSSAFSRKQESLDDSLEYILECEKLSVIDIETLEQTSSFELGRTAGIRRRLRTAIKSFKAAVEVINSHSKTFIPFLPDELDDLLDLFDTTLGNLACFVYHQFELINYTQSNVYEEMSNVLDIYLRENGGLSQDDLYVLSVRVRAIMQQFAPKIGVFDKYPELLEQFSELVGEDLYDCEFITIDLVKDLLSGKVNLEDFRNYITSKIEEDDSSEDY